MQVHGASAAANTRPGQPVRSCESLTALRFPDGTTVTSASQTTTTPVICNVELLVPQNIHMRVSLPVATWNGRFQGVGGGGFDGSVPDTESAAKAGYAAAGSDSGHTADSSDASWAWSPTGMNASLINDFLSRALHETTVKGKAVTQAFYGKSPTLWYGILPGASFARLAATARGDGVPTPLASGWFTYWLAKDPSFDWHSLTLANFTQYFDQSRQEWGPVVGTDDPDLSAFRAAGGKLLLWHGLADQLIPSQGTIRYYEQVTAAMGGRAKTEQFARLFTATGVGHCRGGSGAAPADPLAALVKWVEHGKAPTTLRAENGSMSRPLCRWPAVARYDGHGSTNDAAAAPAASDALSVSAGTDHGKMTVKPHVFDLGFHRGAGDANRTRALLDRQAIVPLWSLPRAVGLETTPVQFRAWGSNPGKATAGPATPAGIRVGRRSTGPHFRAVWMR
ncbi:tannase/feruloyl esterase family alpha/beta hydrolase [Streptomyces sp. B4I13]|uniref:tannase/feruloyl esterase family alpha/beta hydrolase n=1 Tax=Streptomyces sp. B4I13 TaxID=3042271 RepID=UPI0027D82193|nr:tannase/feruloyl esterase family alpha/beta hydrolase [Streptomyces sp. B4I13]